jgi:hypothetical protein
MNMVRTRGEIVAFYLVLEGDALASPPAYVILMENGKRSFCTALGNAPSPKGKRLIYLEIERKWLAESFVEIWARERLRVDLKGVLDLLEAADGREVMPPASAEGGDPDE